MTYDFQIRDHKLTVIATDGVPIEPIVVDSIIALPGERYDVVMDATTLPEISKYFDRNSPLFCLQRNQCETKRFCSSNTFNRSRDGFM